MRNNDLTIIISTTDYHLENTAENIKLTQKQNPYSRIHWVIITNNHSETVPLPETFSQLENIEVHNGFKFEEFQGAHRPGSASAAKGMGHGLQFLKSDFVCQLDADYFIIRPHWVRELTTKMAIENIGVLGCSWDVARKEKWADFPAPHFSIFNLNIIDVSALDFRPNYLGIFELSVDTNFNENDIFIIAKKRLEELLLERTKTQIENLIMRRSPYFNALKQKGDTIMAPLPLAAPDKWAEICEASYQSNLLRVDYSAYYTPAFLNHYSDRASLLPFVKAASQLAFAQSKSRQSLSSIEFNNVLQFRDNMTRIDARLATLEQQIAEVHDVLNYKVNVKFVSRINQWLFEQSKFTKTFKRIIIALKWQKIKRALRQSSGDTNFRVRDYCFKNNIKHLMIPITARHLAKSRSRLKKLVYGVYCKLVGLPVTTNSFARFQLNNYRAMGWEEFFYCGEPFAVHKRTSNVSLDSFTEYANTQRLYHYLHSAAGESMLHNSFLERNQSSEPSQEGAREINRKMHEPYRHQDKRRILELHGSAKTKKCIIVANGPSITPETLDRLTGVSTFACNKINLIFDKTNWRPDYHFCDDPMVLVQNLDSLRDDFDCLKFRPKYLGSDWGFLPRSDDDAIYYNLMYPRWRKQISNPENFDINDYFSNNMSEYLFGGGTVVYSMLQAALYFGYKDIGIIGMNMDFDLSEDTSINPLILTNGQSLPKSAITGFLGSAGYHHMTQFHFNNFEVYEVLSALSNPGDFYHTNNDNGAEFFIYDRFDTQKVYINFSDNRIQRLALLPTRTSGDLSEVNDVAINSVKVASFKAQNHFSDKYRSPKEFWFAPNLKTINLALEIAKISAHNIDANIVNLTSGGSKISTLPTDDLENFIRK
jgi:hypothetical protein